MKFSGLHFINWYETIKARKKQKNHTIRSIAFSIGVLTFMLLVIQTTTNILVNVSARDARDCDIRAEPWNVDAVISEDSYQKLNAISEIQIAGEIDFQVIVENKLYRGNAPNIQTTTPFYNKILDEYASMLGNGVCIVNKKLAEVLNVTINTTLTVKLVPEMISQNYTIIAIVDFNKIGNPYRDHLFLTNVSNIWLANSSRYPAQLYNRINIKIHRPSYLYQMDQLSATKSYLVKISDEVAHSVNDLQLRYTFPLYNEVKGEYTIFFAVQLVKFFFGIMAIILCGLYIYNTVSTDVTTQMHDIGIQQAIGVHNKVIGKQYLLKGLRIGLISTTIGIIGTIIIYLLLLPFTKDVFIALYGVPTRFIFTWQDFGLIFMIGVGSSVVMSAIPAYRSSKIDPIDAINADRQLIDHGLWINKGKYVQILILVIGLLLVFISIYFVVVIPELIIQENTVQLAQIAIFSAMGFLLGTTIATFSLVIKGSSRLLAFLRTKLSLISSKSIDTHASRTSLISLLIILNIGIVGTFSTFLTILDNQLVLQNKQQFGAPIRCETNDLTQADLVKLATVENIASISGVIFQHPLDRQLDIGSLDITFSDAGGVISTDGYIYGIDAAYANTIYTEAVVMDTGSFTAISQLFTHNYSAFISDKIAYQLQLKIGDTFKITVNRNIGKTQSLFTVCGIYKVLPDLYRDIGSDLAPESISGVVLSRNAYYELMQLPTGDHGLIRRLYIRNTNVQNKTEANEIIAKLKVINPNISASNSIQYSDNITDAFKIIRMSIVALLILLVISIIGTMVLAFYSTLVERKQEFIVMHMVGVSIKDIEHMLVMEMLTISFWQCCFGWVAGYLTALLLMNITNIFFVNNMMVVPSFSFFGIMLGMLWGIIWIESKRAFRSFSKNIIE